MKHIYLVTGNPNKLQEWRMLVPDTIQLESIDIDLPEIQSVDAVEIAVDKAKRAYEAVSKPVVVEDVEAGLAKLNGLPGPLIKFFNAKLGKDALYKLAGKEGEKATVACTIAYYDGKKTLVARGEVKGTIVAPRGEAFGFDIVFVPDGESQTYAEMGSEKKNSLSHRSQAIRQFVELIQAE